MLYAKGKVLFIHIPKTGGRNASRIIQHHGGLSKKSKFNSHVTAPSIRQYIEDYDDIFKCAFVRNTWDWLVSMYFQIKASTEHPDYTRVFNSSFEQYIKWLIYVRRTRPKDMPVYGDTVWMYKLKQSGAYPYYPTFTEYLKQNGEVIVDYIGFTHEFQKSIDEICDHLGYGPVQTKKKNMTANKTANYTTYYTDETAELVYDNFREDIDWFNFKFGENINE